VIGDALWDFLTWGRPENFGPILADGVILIAIVWLIVWLVRGWRRSRREISQGFDGWR
jgi:hypothetical protein